MGPLPSAQADDGSIRSLRDARPLELAVVLAVVLALVVVAANIVWKSTRPPQRNVLLIMTDDQTIESLRMMDSVASLISTPGTTYSRYYTSTPNCCPSRASFYSGQYPHNSGVKDNIPPLGGVGTFEPHKAGSLGPWLQQAGYYTAHLGKYLNGWGETTPPENWSGGIAPPPGWDHWFGLIDPTTYQFFNYKVSDDGQERAFGAADEDYQTDVLGAETERTLDRAAKSGKPWFVMWTPVAPHVGKAGAPQHQVKPGYDNLTTVPAPRHKGRFANVPLFDAPSRAYGAEAAANADLAGKPAYIRERVRKGPVNRELVELQYRSELEALQAVDEWVRKLYDKVAALGQLDNTDFIFTSDNGFFHAEHGLNNKGLLYEEAAHLPLVARGPDFPAGARADQLAVQVDLTATVLGIARGTATNDLDGRDLRPLARSAEVGTDRAILLEYWYSYSNVSTLALRLGNWSLMKWSTGETELYELGADPFQQRNVAADPAYASVVKDLTPRLDALVACAGASCEDSDASRKR